eukprot:scaffold2372_cov158-Amphora_coffeaeformis.AAC.2
MTGSVNTYSYIRRRSCQRSRGCGCEGVAANPTMSNRNTRKQGSCWLVSTFFFYFDATSARKIGSNTAFMMVLIPHKFPSDSTRLTYIHRDAPFIGGYELASY